MVTGKINNLQALRAYAALWVVLYHTGYVFPHFQQMGKFGVDIFFVLSGYIIASICTRDRGFFFSRRLIRIGPPYWLLTLALFVFARHFPHLLQSTHPLYSDLVNSLCFIPFYKMGLIRPVLYVGWSLNYEMLFYLVIAAGLRSFPQRPVLAGAALLIGVQAVCSNLTQAGAIAECYGNPIIYEFILGILVYEATSHPAAERALRYRAALVVLLTTSLAGLIILQGTSLQAHAFQPLGLQLAATLLVTTAILLARAGLDIPAGLVVLVGDASYVLYLTHPYVLVLVDRVIARQIRGVHIDSFIGSSACIVVCTSLAILLHLKLERPAVSYLNKRFGGGMKALEFRQISAVEKQVVS